MTRLPQALSIGNMSKIYLVTLSVDNQEKNRCVDIIQDLNGAANLKT